MVLTYHGEGPFTEGLNELMMGPTTVECGIWCPLAFWFATRYTFGVTKVLSSFRLENGQFKLTQECYCPMNKEGTDGNLLFPFYDHPSLYRRMTDLPESQTRIQIKAIFNHPKYLLRHPAGHARLLNVIQIGDSYIAFDPEPSQPTFSLKELQHTRLEAYKRPRDDFDGEILRVRERLPEHEHPDFAPKTFGALAEEARQFENCTLSETEWINSRSKDHRKLLISTKTLKMRCPMQWTNASGP